MYRAQPKASKLLSAKWQEKDHQIHLKKLKDIKSALNVKRPASYNHLKTKPKKNQMLEGKLAYTDFFDQLTNINVERYIEIERENRILLEKMTNILQNPKGISHANDHMLLQN